MISNKIHISERFRRLSKEGMWIVTGQVVTIAGLLVGIRLLTGLMSSKEYGELALGMTVATLVSQVLLGPLSNGATRFYAPAQEAGDFSGYIKAVRHLVTAATGIIILMLLLAVGGLFTAGKPELIPLAVTAIVFAILSGYNSILSGVQSAARQRAIVALHSGMGAWARYLVAAGLILWLGATSTAAMAGYAFATILVLVSQYVFFGRLLKRHKTAITENRQNWSKEIWKFSWPYMSWGIFIWAQQVSDRWALGLFSSTEDVGLYAALFQLGYYPIILASGTATQFLAPIFFQRAGDASDSMRNANVTKLTWRLTSFAIGLTAVAFLIGFLFHNLIFHIFVAEAYWSVSYLLPWMLLGGGIFAAGQTIELNLVSRMKTNIIVMAKIVTAILAVGFNFAGAYWLGIKGIALAGILFSVSYFIWMAVLSKKSSNPIKITLLAIL